MYNYNSNNEKLGLIENRNSTFYNYFFAIVFAIIMILILIFCILNYF